MKRRTVGVALGSLLVAGVVAGAADLGKEDVKALESAARTSDG